jgi:hypothetical protein
MYSPLDAFPFDELPQGEAPMFGEIQWITSDIGLPAGELRAEVWGSPSPLVETIVLDDLIKQLEDFFKVDVFPAIPIPPEPEFEEPFPEDGADISDDPCPPRNPHCDYAGPFYSYEDARAYTEGLPVGVFWIFDCEGGVWVEICSS